MSVEVSVEVSVSGAVEAGAVEANVVVSVVEEEEQHICSISPGYFRDKP